MLIRMPDEAPLVNQPADAHITRFAASQGTYLHMTPQDLMRDHKLASRVLGQSQIFDELAYFQAQHKMAVKVKIHQVGQRVSFLRRPCIGSQYPPIVAQLGYTWAAYFRSLGVMPYEQRHTWDVRVLLILEGHGQC
jgi:hypothetical protein